MAVNQEFLLYVQQQLAGMDDVVYKKMFGGIGIFKDNLMFAKIGDSTLRLKVDDTNKSQFEEKGMQPYYSETKKKGMPYWEVPKEIVENQNALLQWAQQSLEIAKNAANKKK